MKKKKFRIFHSVFGRILSVCFVIHILFLFNVVQIYAYFGFMLLEANAEYLWIKDVEPFPFILTVFDLNSILGENVNHEIKETDPKWYIEKICNI